MDQDRRGRHASPEDLPRDDRFPPDGFAADDAGATGRPSFSASFAAFFVVAASRVPYSGSLATPSSDVPPARSLAKRAAASR